MIISEELSSSCSVTTIHQIESREELIYGAKLLESAERYDDVRWMMKKIIELFDSELSTEERNMLWIAYKNVIGSKRLALKITTSTCDQLTNKMEFHQLKLAQLYQQHIEHEINDICHELFHLLDHYLIPTATRNEDRASMIFFYKMKGDYHRYLSESKKGDEFSHHSQLALEAYKKATYYEEITLNE